MSTTTQNHTHPTPKLIDFQDLHEKYAQRLLASMINLTKNREAAQDAVAGAFAKAFEKRDTFRGRSSPYTWLHAIAFHEALANKRRSRDHASLDAFDCDRSDSWIALELEQPEMEQSDCSARLRQILRRMPAMYRQVLMDRYLRNLSTRQIARRRKVPLGTALSRIFTAKKLLRAEWQSQARRCPSDAFRLI